jgi:histo-blood group ABO system transferase
MDIGLLIIATGKYKVFLEDLIKSADNFFLKEHNVTYFLFVDELVDINSDRNIEQIIIEHKPWPFPTLLRYKNFINNSDKLKDLDYIYYVDSDMIFENVVGDEIFGDVVCVAHPWFIGNRGTPENDSKSLAYIPDEVNFQYMAGAFFGGTKDCILNMFQFIAKQIDIDYSRGVIAKWHDESHSNKFFIMYSTKVLPPEYCYNKQSQYCTNVKNWVPRVVQVLKNDHEIRS